MARKLGSLLVLVVVLALVAFTISPALAHHKDDHEQGPPAREAEDDDAKEGGGAQGGGGGGDDDDIDDDNDDNKHPSGKDRETNDGSTDDVQGGTQTSNPDN
ncbi:MAG: hypothetical protein M3161_05845, partial [Actinomycetota bacterium]|nr:hypothetical protein [Actinomycetota bacterium]